MNFTLFAGVEPGLALRVKNDSSSTAYFNKKAGNYDFFFTVPPQASRCLAFDQITDLDTIDLGFSDSKVTTKANLHNSNSGANREYDTNQYCLVIDKNKSLTSPKNCPIQLYGDGDQANPLLNFSVHIENGYSEPVRIEVQRSKDLRLAMTVLGRTNNDEGNPAITVLTNDSMSASTFLISAEMLMMQKDSKGYALDVSDMAGTDYAELVFYLPLRKDDGQARVKALMQQPYAIDLDQPKGSDYVNLKSSRWPLEKDTQEARVDQFYLKVTIARWGLANSVDGNTGNFSGYSYNVMIDQVNQSQYNDVKDNEDDTDIDTDPESEDNG